MKVFFVIISAYILILFGFILDVSAQKKTRRGQVCGNPKLACKSRENFQPNDLPFETERNFVIAESEFFYAIILKSEKRPDYTDCEKRFPENERLAVQALFPENKVFAVRCGEAGENYYTNVAADVTFLGVYAGRTLSEANKFLKTVQATGKFPGVKVRRMHAGINGT
jgi:hypothetical protein